MRKSVKVRVLIFDILNEIYEKNKNFDDSFVTLTQNYKFNNQDRSMIFNICLLYTSPSPRDKRQSRMPSSA